MTETAILQIITLVGGALAYAYQAFRTSRAAARVKATREQERAWALEDEVRREATRVANEAAQRQADAAAREQAARDRHDLVETLVNAVRRDLEKEARTNRREIRRVQQGLARSASMNSEALSAANHVNLKLANLTHALREALGNKDPKTAEELAAIEGIVSDLDAMRERLHSRELLTDTDDLQEEPTPS